MRDAAADGDPAEHDVDVTGDWELIIRTPIGRQEVTLELERRDGVLAGRARGSAESVPLQNLTARGHQLTWDQSITRPLRLNLHFDVRVTGDELTGTSRAGRLPSSRVTGRRATGRSGT
jgi:hypothetical protein